MKKIEAKKVKSDKQVKFSFVKLKEIFFHIWKQLEDPYYTGFAAQTAYFFFMASMPTLIVLSQFLGFFNISLDAIRSWVEAHVDSHMSGFVMGLFSASSVKMTNLVMVALAFWSASSLQFSLSRLSSHILSRGTYRFNFWTERLKAVPNAIFSITAIAFTLAVYVYGEQIFNEIFGNYHLAKILLNIRLPIAFMLFFAMILFNYYMIPRLKISVRAVIPGAVLATIGIMIVTAVYAYYVGYVANYDILYGSFTNIVALMLWFYLISWVICIGMMFNRAWDEIMEKNRIKYRKKKL